MIELRDYQRDLLVRTSAALKCVRRVLAVMPTGGGKTVCFTVAAGSAVGRGARTAVIVHRQELVMQTSMTLAKAGLRHALICPRDVRGAIIKRHLYELGDCFVENENCDTLLWVASIQTLARRLARYSFDFIIFDEAHHCVAGQWLNLIKAVPNAKIMGVTATPERLDGKGLGVVFEDMVVGPQPRWLIDNGFLAQPVVRSFEASDIETYRELDSVRIKGHDFDQEQVDAILERAFVYGDAVSTYRKYGQGAPYIAFLPTVARAGAFAEQLRNDGWNAVSVDGMTDDAVRRNAIRDLGLGKINVLTNCCLIDEGVDVPVVMGAILLRKDKSLTRYLQSVGRAGRIAPRKTHSNIHDHVGNWIMHSLPDANREWSLDGRKARKKSEVSGPSLKTCSSCYAVFPGNLRECPECGWQVPLTERTEMLQISGELVEITREHTEQAEFERRQREAAEREARQDEVRKARTLEQLLEIAKTRGHAPGWAYHIMRSRAGKGGQMKMNFGGKK